MKLKARLDYVLEHTEVSKEAYGCYSIRLKDLNYSAKHIFFNSQVYDRICYDDTPSQKPGVGRYTLKQAYRCALSDIQISILNKMYNLEH